jgi:type II secretory pathway pseudopilin PulG
MIEALVTMVLVLLLSLMLIPQFTGSTNDAANNQAHSTAQAALSTASALYESTGQLPNYSAEEAQDPDVTFLNSESAAASPTAASVGVDSTGTEFATAVPGANNECWMALWNTNDTSNSLPPTIYGAESSTDVGFNCQASFALSLSTCPATTSNSGQSWSTPLQCTFGTSSSTTTTVLGAGEPTSTILENISPPTPSVVTNNYGSPTDTMTWSWPASTGGTGTITYHWSVSPTAGGTCASGTTTYTTVTCSTLVPATQYTMSVYTQDSLGNTSTVASTTDTAVSTPATTTTVGSGTTVPVTLTTPTPSVSANTYSASGDTMAWTWPASTGGVGAVTYHWQVSPWSSSCTLGSTTGTSVSCTNTLSAGTIYTFTVYAQDSQGNDSAKASVTTTAASPTTTTTTGGSSTTGFSLSTPTPAVTSNSSPSTGDGTMGWTWSTSTGGSGQVTYYWSLSPQTSNCSTGSSSVTSLSCAGSMTPGVAYTLSVYGQDTSGHTSGVGYVTQTQVAHATVPDPPTGLTCSTSASSQSVAAWTAPVNDGGYTISGYVVTYSAYPYSNWTTATSNAGSSPYTITGLTNGTTYECEVAATNPVGTGNPSAPSSPFTPSAIPGAPTGATATNGVNAASTVSWVAPSDNGGSIITSYTVTATDTTSSSRGSQICTTGGALSCTVTGLTNGDSYTFSVTATNASGTGPSSTPTSPITPAENVPGAPTNAVASARYQGALVTWSPPTSNGGAAITLYTVTAADSTNSANGGQVLTATTGSVVFTGLTNGDSYTFTATATNAIGTGPASSPTNAVTPVTTVPDAPTNVSAGVGNASSVVTYSAPSYTGGSGITSYTLQYAVSPYTSWTPATTTPPTCATTSCTVTGLTNGVTYEFEVAATNSTGTGPWSSPSSPVTPITVPGAPTGVVGSVADQSSVISWSAPASNGGSAITLYTVTSNSTADATAHSCTTSVSTTCTVTGLTDGDAYTYTVTATNAAGTGNASAPSSSATPAHVPGTPTGPMATPSNASATLTWNAPSSNGGNAITSYVIQYATSPYSTWTSASSTTPVTCTTTTCTVTGLANGTTYEFEVAALNAVGPGPWSVATTPVTPVTVPTAPTNLTAVSANASASLSWNAPSSNGGESITSYIVQSSTAPYTNWASATTSPVTCTATTCTATGLANGTTYEFEVAALNGVGPGPWSAASSPTTPATTANAPTGLSVTSYENTKVPLSWTAPTSNGGASITSYTIEQSVAPYTTWTPSTLSPGTCTTTSCTVIGLTNGTTYEFEVAAVNSAGTGTYSAPSPTALPSTVPTAPLSVQASLGNNSSEVSWSAPASNGGAPITLYTVTASDHTSPGNGGQSCTSSSLAPCTVTGLTNGDTYSFVVTATNGSGVGPVSAPSNSVVPIPVPSAPLNPLATPGNAQATVTWSASSSNGGTPITSYTVTATDQTTPANGGQTCTWSTGALTCTLTSLTNGNSYTFTVTATNANGTGPASVATTPVTPFTTPGAPTGVAGVSYANSQAAVSWNAPTDTGGSPITAYELQYAAGPSYSSWTVFSTTITGTSTTVTGLTNGTNYEFEVAAQNTAGWGPYSTPSSPVLPATTPGVPTGVSATSNVNQSSVVSFSAPTNTGGAGVSSYLIEYATAPYTSWITATTSAPCTTTTCTVTNLTNGTNYEFEVAATTPAGTGAYSAPSAPATPAGAPSAPSALNCSSNLNASSVATWNAPANNGAAIDGYTVEYASSPYTSWLTASSSASSPYTITGLTNGTTYECQVAAHNAAGLGSYSTPVLFTPSTVPGTVVNVTSSFGPSQVSVSWGSGTPTGGSPILGYTVTAADSTTPANGGQTCSTGGALGCIVSGLTNGDTYVFSVYATNANGNSATPYATTTAVPSTTPGPPTGVTAVAGSSQAAVSWTPPASNGGNGPLSYTVQYSSDGGSTWTSATTTASGSGYTVTGLTIGTAYVFQVYASNINGLSPADGPTTPAVTPYTTPGTPQNPLATNQGPGQVQVQWNAPSSGGSPITGYTVTVSGGSGGTCTVTGTNTTCTASGLANATTYSFSIVATNVAGNSATPASVSDTTWSAPGAPQSVSVANVSGGEVMVSWSAPASNGGSPVTSYYVGTPSGSQSCTTGASGTFCYVTGLNNGTSYTFYVYATNAVGTGPDAYTGSVTTYSAPGQPYDTGGDSATGTSVTYTFANSYNGGGSYQNWTLYGACSGSGSDGGSNSYSITCNGLAPSTYYTEYAYTTSQYGVTSPAGSITFETSSPPGTPSVSDYSNGVGTVEFQIYVPSGAYPITVNYSGSCSGQITGISGGNATYVSCGNGTTNQGQTLTLYASASNTAGTSGTGSGSGTTTYNVPTGIFAAKVAITTGEAEVSWSTSSTYGVTNARLEIYSGSCSSGVSSGSTSYTSSNNTQSGNVTVAGTYSTSVSYSALMTITNPAGSAVSGCVNLGDG